MNVYYGDIRIDHDGITWVNGQPKMDAGLWTAVYLSLFTDLGWWADPDAGSNLYEYEDVTLTQDVANDIRDSCIDALEWLKDDGIAESITVTTEIQKPEFLAILIEIKEPGKQNSTTYRFAISWRETEEAA